MLARVVTIHSSSNVTQLADELGKFVTDAIDSTRLRRYHWIRHDIRMHEYCFTGYLIAFVEMNK